MNTIKLNNTVFELEGYSKTTPFEEGNIFSNGQCDIKNVNIDNAYTLAEEPITLVQIYHDNNLIYNLQDISAHINSISEGFNGERISVSLNLTFDI